tara:strand:+ start:1125 stop:1307 length:183 start_codon:yes stop_codon:yes gene_type:complete
MIIKKLFWQPLIMKGFLLCGWLTIEKLIIEVWQNLSSLSGGTGALAIRYPQSFYFTKKVR